MEALVRVGRKEVGIYLHSVAVNLLRGANNVGVLAYGRRNIEKATYLTHLASTMGLKVSTTEPRKERIKVRDERGQEKEIEITGLHFSLTKT